MKLQDIKLPNYTRTEDKVNSFTHLLGVPLGIVVLVLCIHRSLDSGTTWSMVSSIIYGISMIVLYTGSALYHYTKPGKAKKVLRIIDHCVIFLLIAGSITPYALVAVRPDYPVYCWLAIIAAWGAAVLGITCTAVNHEKFKKLQMVLYLAVGWVMVFGIKPLLKVFSGSFRMGLIIFFIGGGLYTIGAILYGVGKKIRYFHAVFHVFALAGSVMVQISIYNYVLKL